MAVEIAHLGPIDEASRCFFFMAPFSGAGCDVLDASHPDAVPPVPSRAADGWRPACVTAWSRSSAAAILAGRCWHPPPAEARHHGHQSGPRRRDPTIRVPDRKLETNPRGAIRRLQRRPGVPRTLPRVRRRPPLRPSRAARPAGAGYSARQSSWFCWLANNCNSPIASRRKNNMEVAKYKDHGLTAGAEFCRS